jgi:hypothetical protein
MLGFSIYPLFYSDLQQPISKQNTKIIPTTTQTILCFRIRCHNIPETTIQPFLSQLGDVHTTHPLAWSCIKVPCSSFDDPPECCCIPRVSQLACDFRRGHAGSSSGRTQSIDVEGCKTEKVRCTRSPLSFISRLCMSLTGFKNMFRGL